MRNEEDESTTHAADDGAPIPHSAFRTPHSLPTPLTDEERAVYEWQIWVSGFGEAGHDRVIALVFILVRIDQLFEPRFRGDEFGREALRGVARARDRHSVEW